MPLFDAYALVDFSARSTPSPAAPVADALWLGWCQSVGPVASDYFRTRSELWSALEDWLASEFAHGRRVLVGVDFALGYPAGFAAALTGRPDAHWQHVWQWLDERVEDHPDNRNNRFEIAAEINRTLGCGAGPMWGCPPAAAGPWLQSKRHFGWPVLLPDGRTLDRLRTVDCRCPGVQEVWKLAGVGSVGSQSLLGIAGLWRLMHAPALVGQLRLWPMQTGWGTAPDADTPGGARLVEAFPSLLGEAVRALQQAHGWVRDRAQVHAWCDWARRRDHAGTLAEMFAPPTAGHGEEDATLSSVLREQGWVFGDF